MSAPQNILPGWLDGLTTQRITRLGHVSVQLGPWHALIWPGNTQGSFQNYTKRLNSIGTFARLLPARHGRRINKAQDLYDLVHERHEQIASTIAYIAGCQQFSIGMRVIMGDTLSDQVSSREKYVQQEQAQRQALEPVLAALRPLARSISRPENTAQGRLRVHLLIPAENAEPVRRLWPTISQHHPQKATLIGPIPPFAFSNL